ncbi:MULTISPECIES: PAS domain S-box protein [Flavobacterium]|uniref:PAS domain-containing sensor histidine kinase n=1 Tax=Flavobacterium TaxID=237 RepID=UPI002114D0C6|nr:MULTISPECIES: PAS domain S-box protein [Flavobacterium]UUF12417.1 PAS domain S-box protein [Flavobacterium panici]
MKSKPKKNKSSLSLNSSAQLHDLCKILDFSMDLICSFDRQGRFVWVNKAVNHILGYKPEELMGEVYTDFAFAEDIDNPHIGLSFKNATQLSIFEKRFLHKNGSIVYLQWSLVRDDIKKLSYGIGRNITEEKKMKKAFEIEQLRFHNLYSQAPACMGILKGPNHVYELANERYLQLIQRKDIIGKSIKEVLPEMKAQGIIKILDAVYQTGETFSANEKLIKFDLFGTGELTDVYLNFICQAHRNAENTIDGIFFFASDVTEQVLSRRKIEEREQMYRELIDKLPVAAYSCDAQGRILVYNKAAAALWGKNPVIGKDFWDNSWNASENIKSSVSLCSMAEDLKEAGPNPVREIIIKRPNGEKRNVLPYPVPFRDSQGKVTGAVIVLADITEMKLAQKALRKSEKKYRYLFDNNPMPMWIIEPVTFKFLDVNKMAVLQYGYSREEFLSMTALDIRPLEDKNHFINSSDPSAINQSNYNRGTWNHLKKDGTIIPVEIIAHDISYEDRQARLILSNNISDRKKAEQNLEKRNEALIKTNLELDRFVYSVSHDLRSPLTSVLGLVSFIETDSQEADTLKHAALIRNSICRLDNFIKNILSYSRNNRTGLEIEKISLNDTVQEIIASFQTIKEATGIRFLTDIRAEHPFYTDKVRIVTILENLISNAIKHHKKDHSDRYIKIAAHSDSKSLQFTIEDNGMGIDQAYHQKIYEMFFRISNTDGSGIGLYIVKDAVELLEGSIEIQSEKGTGSVFMITLKNLKP